jgi:hypothetical protein
MLKALCRDTRNPPHARRLERDRLGREVKESHNFSFATLLDAVSFQLNLRVVRGKPCDDEFPMITPRPLAIQTSTKARDQ